MRFSSQTDIERRKAKLIEVLGELPSEIKKEAPQTAIIKRHPPIWIYGKPGKGKTTVAHLIAIKELDDSISVSDNGRIELQSPSRAVSVSGNSFSTQHFIHQNFFVFPGFIFSSWISFPSAASLLNNAAASKLGSLNSEWRNSPTGLILWSRDDKSKFQ